MTGHIIIFLIVAIVLLLIGVPVAATLGLSSILFFVLEGIPASTHPLITPSSIQNMDITMRTSARCLNRYTMSNVAKISSAL